MIASCVNKLATVFVELDIVAYSCQSLFEV